MSDANFILGIAGGTGSGKSWLARRVLESFRGRASVLQMDWYYRDQSRVRGGARLRLNFDHPRAIEMALLVQDLRRLRMGLPVLAPQYDYATHRRLGRGVPVQARSLLIIEGLFVFHEPRIRELVDHGVFLDVPADTRLMLRLRRDRAARKLDIEETLRLYESFARPMHDKFVEPSARWAHEVWDGLSGETRIKRLIRRLKSRVTHEHDH